MFASLKLKKKDSISCFLPFVDFSTVRQLSICQYWLFIMVILRDQSFSEVPIPWASGRTWSLNGDVTITSVGHHHFVWYGKCRTRIDYLLMYIEAYWKHICWFASHSLHSNSQCMYHHLIHFGSYHVMTLNACIHLLLFGKGIGCCENNKQNNYII